MRAPAAGRQVKEGVLVEEVVNIMAIEIIMQRQVVADSRLILRDQVYSHIHPLAVYFSWFLNLPKTILLVGLPASLLFLRFLFAFVKL